MFTQAELAALKRAYASGTTEVRYEGKLVRYDTGEQLLARIRVIEAEISAAGGNRKPSAGFASFVRR